MSRIPSATVDQGFYFVALDSVDYSTPKTGLATWTVYRTRNNAAAAAMTTPTITEVSSANMPGVYFLLCDEDMTIGSGNDEEEMTYRITHAGMVPVVKTIELYRSKVTEGVTLLVDSNGAPNFTVEGSLDLVETLRLIGAALLGKLSGASSTTITIRDMSDTKTRITATVDVDGNRSALTLDPS